MNHEELPRGKSSNFTGPTAEPLEGVRLIALPEGKVEQWPFLPPVCVYETEMDGHRMRVEAPTADELVKILKALEVGPK